MSSAIKNLAEKTSKAASSTAKAATSAAKSASTSSGSSGILPTTSSAKGDSTLKSASKEFLNSNNMITKFAFILGVLIIFMYVLRFIISFIGWMFTPSNSPYLINGISDTNSSRTILVDPNEKMSKPIMRSKNEVKGVEFTWSIWLFIKGLNSSSSGESWMNIFNKGDITDKAGSGEFLHSGPGLYIATSTNTVGGSNKIKVRMNKFNYNATSSVELYDEIEVNDIPLNKWVNVMIRCEGNMLDIFINGMIVKRKKINGVPKQNYHNVHICPNKPPFEGYISDLRYWNESLGTNAIYNIISNGPNTKNFDNSANKDTRYPRYFATRWFTKIE